MVVVAVVALGRVARDTSPLLVGKARARPIDRGVHLDRQRLVGRQQLDQAATGRESARSSPVRACRLDPPRSAHPAESGRGARASGTVRPDGPRATAPPPARPWVPDPAARVSRWPTIEGATGECCCPAGRFAAGRSRRCLLDATHAARLGSATPRRGRPGDDVASSIRPGWRSGHGLHLEGAAHSPVDLGSALETDSARADSWLRVAASAMYTAFRPTFRPARGLRPVMIAETRSDTAARTDSA